MEGQDATTDFALLDAWARGDRDAGNRLFDRHFPAVFRFFRNKVDDQAEDLTQATFLACVKNAGQMEKRASFRTYLFAIARNQLYMHFRAAARQGAVLEFGSVSAEDLGTSPSSRLVAKHEQRLLLRALRRIPVDLQVAVELYYWEGLSTRELAEIFEIPEGTVRSRLTRARDRIAAQLAELAEAPGEASTTMDCFERWARSLRKLT